MENAAINNDLLHHTANHALPNYDDAAYLPIQQKITPAPVSENRSNTEQTIWQQLKTVLQRYCVEESNNPEVSARVIQLGSELIQQIANSPQYAHVLRAARSEPMAEKPQLSHRLLSDEVLQVSLETIFKARPTPLHTYSGPAGLILIVEGSLSLTSYTEQVNALTDCTLLSKLTQKTVSHLQPGQGTLFNQDTGSIIEMHAQQDHCLFFNIHLKDEARYPHYFYYPTYHGTSPDSVFTRRVKSHSR